MRGLALTTLFGLAACSGDPEPLEDTGDWWTPAEPLEVQETIRWTESAYGDLPGDGVGIAQALDPVLPADGTVYAPGDAFGEEDCDVGVSGDLPVEIEGIVTLHPRWYMKLDGCNRGEEKYYGNWFIEDDTGGMFIVGDTRVAHFDVGDRVRLRVRAVRTNFGMDMIYAHDVLEVSREARPVRYAWANDGLDQDDIGRVRRVRGVIEAGPDTFGELVLRTDDGAEVLLNLDAQMNRRRAYPEVGQTVCATGPVLYSFSEYSIVIMRIGQIAVIEPGDACPDT
jgi:hypothetical protein